jgi:hypothetical protein
MSLKQQRESENEVVFNYLFVRSIEEVISYVLGDYSLEIILSNMEKNGVRKYDIVNNLVMFQNTIHSAIGRYRTPANLLLRCIIENLCQYMNIECDKEKSYHFVEYINKLKEAYLKNQGGENS